LTLVCAGLLEPRGLVYVQPFRRNLLLKCEPQPKIAKNSLKPLILRVQVHSRSSTLTFLRSSLPVLVMISSMSVPICNHLHAKRTNTCKITSFRRGCSSFAHSFVGTPFTQWPQLSQNTRDSGLSCAVNPKSSHLGLKRYRVVTDGQTDGQTKLP